jgi:hypothetical protein
MEISILLESTDPITGRVVATVGGLPDHPRTDIRFLGWLSLLHALEDLIGSSSSPPRSLE